MTKTVGRFTIDGETLSGPAEYMREQGDARLAEVLAGKNEVFNMTAHLSPDVETALLVNLQTDFAGWLGTRQMMEWLKRPARRTK